MHGRCKRPAFSVPERFLHSFHSELPARRSTDETADSVFGAQIATDPQVFVAIEPGELEDLGRLHRSRTNSLTALTAPLRCRRRCVEVFGFSRIKRPFRKTLGWSASFAGFCGELFSAASEDWFRLHQVSGVRPDLWYCIWRMGLVCIRSTFMGNSHAATRWLTVFYFNRLS